MTREGCSRSGSNIRGILQKRGLVALALFVRTVWSGEGCENETEAFENDNLRAPSWVVQALPSGEHPFVFLHQRKSGGTSWRKHIHERAKELARVRLGLESTEEVESEMTEAFVPCFTHGCATWTIPNPFRRGEGRGKKYTMFAGHLPWSSIRSQLPSHARTRRYHMDDFRGLTNFRHPITRVVSCLSFRFKDFSSSESIRALSVEELRNTLLYRLSGFGWGCNNEPIRLLSGFGDEIDINELGLPENRYLANALVQRSKQHLLSRVVGAVLEHEEETNMVVNHYFPWLKLKELPHEQRAKSATLPGSSAASVSPDNFLSAEHRQVILDLNWPEMELYRFACNLLLRQYRQLRRDET